MNDIQLQSTCESIAESLSMLAAGCASAEEDRLVQEHLQGCAPCREKFDQLTSVCGALWTSAPGENLPRPPDSPPVAEVLRRVIAEIDARPMVVDDVSTSTVRSSFRSGSLIRAILAASLLIAVGWHAQRGMSPDAHMARVGQQAARNGSADAPTAPMPLQDRSTEQFIASTHLPTWMALRQAAAESDEALESLLSQSSQTMFSKPLTSLSLLEE